MFENISAVLKGIFMYRCQFLDLILKPATFVIFYVVKLRPLVIYLILQILVLKYIFTAGLETFSLINKHIHIYLVYKLNANIKNLLKFI